MDQARKKELISQYKQTKPPMGVFIIRSHVNNKYYIQGAKDLRAVINGAQARLASGMHPNRELQKEWQEFGSEKFTIEILEHLEYDKDEAKTDYSEDLAVLQGFWEEKLAEEHLEMYKKRI
ncbi:MAG TPA: GIY-YIG nuclease family protein [Bacillota bacterium]|nr:GIY-YIG nuclease family protein [Bacillota bacterium]